jgi:predicted oxidoreductase
MAERYGVSREAIVLAWIHRHPAPILPVIGSTNPDRIASCAEADTITLDRVDWFRLLKAAQGVGMP